MQIPPVSRTVETFYDSQQVSITPKGVEDLLYTCAPCQDRVSAFFRWLWSFFTSLFCCLKENRSFSQLALNYASDQSVRYDPGKRLRCIPYQKETKLTATKRDFIDLASKNEKVALIHHTPSKELEERSKIAEIHERRKELFPLDGNAVVFSPLVPLLPTGKVSIVTSKESTAKQRIWNELFAAFENECETVIFAVSGNVSPYLYLDILQNFFPGTFKKIIFAILNKQNYPNYVKALERYNDKISIE